MHSGSTRPSSGIKALRAQAAADGPASSWMLKPASVPARLWDGARAPRREAAPRRASIGTPLLGHYECYSQADVRETCSGKCTGSRLQCGVRPISVVLARHAEDGLGDPL